MVAGHMSEHTLCRLFKIGASSHTNVYLCYIRFSGDVALLFRDISATFSILLGLFLCLPNVLVCFCLSVCLLLFD